MRQRKANGLAHDSTRDSAYMYVSRTVSVKKRACNFSVKIKVLNFEIKFSGYYKKSVKFLDLFF